MIGQGSEEIRALLSTPIPEVLWHYTSLEALKNIVESKKIWATDIRFLNDSEEHRHAVDLLKEEVERIDDQDIRNMVFELVHAEFLSGILSADSMPVFVASFSAVKDLLSQWRGYTEANRGVALGLDLRGFRPDAESKYAVVFAPCLYKEDEKRGIIRSSIRTLLSDVNRIKSEISQKVFSISNTHQHLPNEDWEQSMQTALGAESPTFEAQYWQAVKRMILALIPVMPLLKHPSFEEEQEWRLVIHADPEKLVLSNEKKIRAGKTSFVPYLDLDLPINVHTSLPTLTELLIGPNPAMKRSLSAAKTFLEWNGFSSIYPQPSATSFRSW